MVNLLLNLSFWYQITLLWNGHWTWNLRQLFNTFLILSGIRYIQGWNVYWYLNLSDIVQYFFHSGRLQLRFWLRNYKFLALLWYYSRWVIFAVTQKVPAIKLGSVPICRGNFSSRSENRCCNRSLLRPLWVQV